VAKRPVIYLTEEQPRAQIHDRGDRWTCSSSAGAGVAEDKAPIVVVEVKPPGACKNLGKVTGTSQGNPVNESRAKMDALGQAKDLGATHFWYKSEYSGQRGSTGWAYDGVAYRCQAVPDPVPSPAK